MAMNGDLLGTQIATVIAGLSPAQKSDLTAVWQAVAKTIVTHLTSSVVVTTAGTAVGQTGTIS